MTQIDTLELNKQNKDKIKEIRNCPITLKFGEYECEVKNENIKYLKWIKKQRNIVSYEISSPVEFRGGIGNKLLCVYKEEIIYYDELGNSFTDPEYWINKEISREEWLKGE